MILLIDGNSIAHANHNANKLTVGDLQVQAIFGFLKSLRAMLNTTAIGAKPIVVWDGKAQWRKDIYPDYKGNRTAMDAKQEAHKAAFKRQSPLLEYALETLGVLQLRSPLLEADDLAAHMVRSTLHSLNVRLVTGDQDWLQMVTPTVSWYDPIRDRTVDQDNFFEFTGYKTIAGFVQGKALQGDTSDNVPGIDKIGKVRAMELIAAYGSVGEFFRQADAGKVAKPGVGLRNLMADEGRAIFRRNMQLMDLSLARKPEQGEVIVKLGQPSPEKFEAFCKRMMFASILRELPQFLASYGVRT